LYIPVIPPTPSATSQILGVRIADLVREFRRSHPDAGAADVEQAFDVARSTLGAELPGGAVRSRALVGLIAGGIALVGVSAGLFATPAGRPGALPMIMIGAVVLGLLAALAARRSGRGAPPPG